MKRLSRRSKDTTAALLGISLTAAMVTAGAASASAIEPDAYLQDYSAADGLIIGDNGNHADYSADLCGFQWTAQSVIDTDLPSYSTNGFLESVQPLGDQSLPGSGWAQLQHWYTGASSDQLNWRIPIALDAPLSSAQVNMVFDDPDWTPNQASFQQYSPWPDRASAFNRFMGDSVGLYQPHDDAKVSPFVWGTDALGYTTLSFNLGDIEAGTSTVLQFTGTAVDGAAGIQSGTSYGAKLTLDGKQPLTTCLTPAYAEQTVLTGDTAQVDPTLSEAISGDKTAVPNGTSFALGADAPAGAVIDSTTGAITWPVPGTQAVGDVIVPVTVTYADGSTDETTALVHIIKEPHLGPFDDQHIVLGNSIIDVMAELVDHLGLAYGEGSSLGVEGLPAGVNFDPETRMISGTPEATGQFPVIVTGYDQNGDELVTSQFLITVTEPTDVEVPPETPATPERPTTPAEPQSPNPNDRLAVTGGTASGAAALVLGALSLIGGVLLWATRRAIGR
ncbi:MAG: Rib/alpha-like domain-containing protein [Leucobacter sp.]